MSANTKMGKVISLVLAFIPSLMWGQSISNNRLRFDNQFRPYVETTVTNDSFTDMTSIECEIVYSWERIGQNFLTKDPRKNTSRTQIVEVTIPAMSKKSITFYIPMVEEYEPTRIFLNKVRYSDGKVKKIK